MAAKSKQITGELASPDGTKLYWVKNLLDNPKAVIVIVHGLAEHLGRYDYVVSKLNSFGYSVYRFDNRGHGKSGGEKGYLDDYNQFLDDADLVVNMAKKENPDKPLFMLGHSMGGYIAAGYGVKYPDKLAGQIFSGAAVIDLPIFDELRQTDFDSAPRTMVPNDLADLICRDQKVVDDYKNDPLVLKETTQKLLGVVFVRGVKWFMDNVKSYRYPCLILHGGNDQIVTPEASKFLYDNISSPDKQLKIYDDLYHEILNEFEKDDVLSDIRNWVEERL